MSDQILKVIEHVIALYDAELVAHGKSFGPLETYTCRTINEAMTKTSQKLDLEEYDGLTAIAEHHVCKVILEASKFLSVVRTADLDREVIRAEIEARAEVILGIVG